MLKLNIRLLVLLASILLVFLILIQVTWVRKAIEIEEQHFSNKVTSALIDVLYEIQRNSNDTIDIFDPIEQVNESMFRVRVHDTINPLYLESLLRLEFSRKELNETFEYGIYDCFSDSLIYRNIVLKSSMPDNTVPINDFIWDDDEGHYFSVHFPNRKRTFFSKLDFWIYSSLFLILVVMFFAYTITIISRQKKIREITKDFINNMTHEFKTPIATIRLSSEALMRDSIINQPEKREKYAKIIQLETERLQNQVERILQLATMEREQIQVSMAKADMQSIVERVVSTFELNIDAIGGKISYIDQAKNHFVLGDEFHLFNIISNLIDNAIKYAKAEPIIEIKSFNEGNYLVISVTDNGVGIEPNEIKYIFDRFYRVPQGNLHDTKGFGIGLNYVKVMLEKHGGHVEVLSTPKKGSTFTVFLPAIK